METAILQTGDAHFLHSPLTELLIFFAGAAESVQSAGSAHQNNIENAVIENRAAGLGNVSNVFGCLADRKCTGIHPIHGYCAGIAGQKTQNAAEQGAFAHAVGAEDGEEFSFAYGKADVMENRSVTVGKA